MRQLNHITNELVINWQDLLRIATVIVTAIITGLVAYRNRFDPGAKYILLRANAENIKREIYMYRVEGDIYGRDTLAKNATTRDAELARRVGDIGSRTMRTEVVSSAVELYDGLFPPKMDAAAGKDDGFSDLDPDQYIAIRIGDQITFYRSKSTRIEKRLKRLE